MSVIITLAPFIIAGTTSLVSAGIAAMSNNDINENSTSEEQQMLRFTTNIRNEELLQKALKNLGANNISSAVNGVQTNIDEFHVVLQKDQTGLFHIKFVGQIGQEEAQKFLNELQEEYGKVVQDYVYTQLKQKAEEKGLSLENEAVQKDQSIVLTYNISSNG